MEPRFVPASDASLMIVVSDAIELAVCARVHSWLRLLLREHPEWLLDAHPAYASLLVELDLTRASLDEVARWLEERQDNLDEHAPLEPHTVEVPVRYGGEEGPDLKDLATHAGLSVDEVVRRHSSASYTVAFLGFQPGFAYLLGLPPSLHMPRLDSPRARVPAGSVAIGGAQTGVYPADSPGGWRILGRTARPMPADWVQPGDCVRFVVERGAP